MKTRLFILIISILLGGCTHMTPYQACNKQDGDSLEWAKYGSMQECVETKKAETAERKAKWKNMFSGMGAQGNSTHCRGDGLGGMNCE